MKKSWTLLKIKKKDYSKYLIDKLEEYGIKNKFIKIKCYENKIRSNKTIDLISFLNKNKSNQIIF